LQGRDVEHEKASEAMRDTIDMAREVYGAHTEWTGAPLDRLEQLVALVRADEREVCLNCYSPDDTATDWADKIRARSNP
jgi:hypothetical protein